MLWFGERLSPVNVIGIAFIVVGVAAVRFG